MFWTIREHGEFMFVSQLAASPYRSLHVYLAASLDTRQACNVPMVVGSDHVHRINKPFWSSCGTVPRPEAISVRLFWCAIVVFTSAQTNRTKRENKPVWFKLMKHGSCENSLRQKIRTTDSNNLKLHVLEQQLAGFQADRRANNRQNDIQRFHNLLVVF